MRWRDYFRLGWDQLKRRKVVTALCAIGIAIGSSSIIVALSFGESVTHYSQQRMSYYLKTDEISVQNLFVDNPDEPDKPVIEKITGQKMDLIRSLPHVKAVAGYANIGSFDFIVDEDKRGGVELVATELNTLTEFDNEFQQGGETDADNTIIISYGVTLDVFDEKAAKIRSMQGERGGRTANPREEQLLSYPLYQKQITLYKEQSMGDGTTKRIEFPVRVVGVLKKPEGMPDSMIRYQKQAYISPALGIKIREAMKTLSPDSQQNEFQEIDEVKVKVDQSANVPQVEKWIQSMKLNTNTNLHQEERMKNEFVIVRLVFGGIGLFVLFVASISIVVAMTMSTYQRRRQIGIMKVLGANLKQIRNMFIVESTLLGLLGGLLGILLSYWVIWGINILVYKFSEGSGGDELLFISFWVLPVGLFFAVLTGVLSGIYPAIKASRTDALTAIKRD